MGKFYFCSEGTHNSPCNRKYQTAKNWLNHMEKDHNVNNAVLPALKEHVKGVDVETGEPREGGTFYFCKGGTPSNPCNRKYITAKNWLNHMEKEHNITDAALPSLENNNNSKRVLRVKRERVQRQKQSDEKTVKALEEQLRSMSQRVTNAESSASETAKKERETRNLLEDAKRRLEFTDGETVASGTEDCVICMINQTTTAIIPCGHTAFCGACADTLKKRRDKCPICRGGIQQTQRLFFS